MMMRLTLLFGAMAMLALLPASAVADWEDDFEAYEVGSGMCGQGGWECWDEDPNVDAYVSDAQSHSPTKSVAIVAPPGGDCDLIHQFSGYTTGPWTFTAWQYVPTDFEGREHFILLSSYEHGMGQDNKWAVQIAFDSYNQVVESEYDDDPNDPNGYVSLPLITGQWVELRTEIDLDNDWFEFYYNDEFLIGKPWTAGPNNQNDGFLVIDALDLYANFVENPVYYDDISLKGPCSGDIDGDGDTDHSDLGVLLSCWGCAQGDPCWEQGDPPCSAADLDGDLVVGHGDLGIVLSDWGCGT